MSASSEGCIFGRMASVLKESLHGLEYSWPKEPDDLGRQPEAVV